MILEQCADGGHLGELEPGTKLKYSVNAISPDNIDETRYFMPLVQFLNPWPAMQWNWNGHPEKEAHTITGQVEEYQDKL